MDAFSYSAVGLASPLLGLAVVLYLAIGALQGLQVLRISLMRWETLVESPDLIGFADAAVEWRAKKWGRAREVTGALLEPVTQVATWPAVRWDARGGSDSKALYESMVRRSRAVAESVWLLLFSALVAVLVGVAGHHWYLRTASYFIVVAILCLQARAVLFGKALRGELRKTVGCPLCRFAVITAASFAALAIVGFVLLRWPPHASFHWNALWLEARDIWGTGRWSAIWQARETSATNILVAVCGATVYVSLISQIWNPFRFRRDEADRIEIAGRLLLAGHAEKVPEWLKEVPTGRDRPPRARALDGMLAINQGDIGRALERARNAGRIEGSPADKDDPSFTIGEWALPFRDATVYSNVIRHLLAAGIHDACLAAVTDRMVNRGDDQMLERLQATVTPPSSDSPAAGSKRLEGGAAGSAYPLTMARFALYRHEFDTAGELLESVQCTLLSQRVLKEIISGEVAVVRAETTSQSEWNKAALHNVHSLLDAARSWPVDQLPSWVREYLANEVEWRAYRLANLLDATTKTALRELDRALIGKPLIFQRW